MSGTQQADGNPAVVDSRYCNPVLVTLLPEDILLTKTECQLIEVINLSIDERIAKDETGIRLLVFFLVLDLGEVHPVDIGLPVGLHPAEFIKSAKAIGAELQAKQVLLAVNQHSLFRLLHQVVYFLAAFFFFIFPW